MMMNDRPNCVCENIRTECGRPLSAISSGIVTCFSTSSAAWPGIQRDHRDLDVGDVGKRLDRQRLESEDAGADEQNQKQEQEQRLMNRKVDNFSEHRFRVRLSGRWSLL